MLAALTGEPYGYAGGNPVNGSDPSGFNTGLPGEQVDDGADAFGGPVSLPPNTPTYGTVAGSALGALAGTAESTVLGAASDVIGVSADAVVRVGRWMSPTEYDAMVSTGRVQKPYNSDVTRVIYPPDPKSYRAAPVSDVYTEFDVAEDCLVPGGRTDWRIIPGPDSTYSRLRVQRGGEPYAWPEATNIETVRTQQ